MNAFLKKGIEAAYRMSRRLQERAGMVSGFADVSMHLWMLNDRGRGEAYDAALRRVVRPGDVVVDIGAGTGLLSMMACRAGAARVYAIEEKPIIDLAKKLVAANGFADRVVFLNANSASVTLPERADVIVSETIGSFVFSEGVVPTLADARRRFLKPGGRIVPSRIAVAIAPYESFEEGVGLLERPVHGFDYREALGSLDLATPGGSRLVTSENFLAAGQPLYDVDLAGGDGDLDFARQLVFDAEREGTLHGFLGYWEADMAEGVSLRCLPGGPPGNWMPSMFRLPRGLAVKRGDRIHLAFGRRDRPGWQWRWEARVEEGPRD